MAEAPAYNEALFRAVPESAHDILDVGCGGGALGAALLAARPGRRVWGADADPARAADAARRLTGAFRLDVERDPVPLPAGSCDCLVYGDVLEHLRDPLAVLRAHRPLLRPGGSVAVSVPNLQHHSLLAALLTGEWQYQEAGLLDRSHLRFFSLSTAYKLLLDAGHLPDLAEVIAVPAPPGLLEAAGPLLAHLRLDPGRVGLRLGAYQYVLRGEPMPEAPADAGGPLTFSVCVDDAAALGANLLASPDLGPGSPHEVLLWRDCGSAAAGHNRALEVARNDVVVCVHQDVYLPAGWCGRFRAAWESAGRPAVSGVYGLRGPGRAGCVIDRDRLLREPAPLPCEADSLDEMLVAVDRASGLRLGPALGWHLYGTDLCQRALAAGLRAAVLEAPCLHDSRSGAGLPPAFWDSARVLAAAWPGRLPLHTPCAAVGDTAGAGGPAGPARLVTDKSPAAGLVSVVVVCFNEAAATRRCVDSVLAHARGPFELVLVDNGSTDSTPELLRGYERGGRAAVAVVRNEANLGYPAGVNRGLAAARGDWVLLLNNDTVVTEGWLGRMLAASAAGVGSGGGPVGLVGAVTNAAPAPQLVEANYEDLAGLADFARRRAAGFAGQVLEVGRLTGFCLLARREAFGGEGLDEGYGLGFFDDDDLCQRARRAGYRLVVALDAFVHHDGSRTFRALGVDTQKALAENYARFRDKWGDEAARPYRLPGGTPAAAPRAAGPARVSLCMIVKDEADNLEACVGPIAHLFHEVVVVDTGSTDGTPDLARRLGAKVSHFDWADSFAAARNESLRHATGDWCFWMDGDDRIDADNRGRLAALFASLPDSNVAYAVKCRCVPSEPGGSATVVDHVRLFRNDPRLRWEYRVHEQILPAVRRAGGSVEWSGVTVDHVGYVDPALRGRKLARDLRLLDLERRERPGDPFVLFNLGSVYNEMGRHAEALECLRGSLAASDPRDSIVRKLHALVAQCESRLGRPAAALAAVKEGRRHYPGDAELLFAESLLLQQAGDLAGAESRLRELIGGREGDHFASVDSGLRGHKARHNLAVLLLGRGRAGEAESQWREAVAAEPGFLPAWLGLGELMLRRADWAGLEEVAKAAQSRGTPGAPAEAEVLLARGELARGEAAAAAGRLSRLAGREPDCLGAWLLLGDAHLARGDGEAADSALRKALELAPGHPGASRGLAEAVRLRGATARGG